MKLIQIKDFTKVTVTQEIAAEIAAIAAWNHLNEPSYKGKFKITNGTPKGVLKTGGGSVMPWDFNRHNELYIRTETGVEIITPNHMRVRIWENGEATAYYSQTSSYSDFEKITRHIPTGNETKHETQTYANYQIRLVQLYLDFGFFTIDQ